MATRIIPEHIEGSQWPVNAFHGQDSWPQYQTFGMHEYLARFFPAPRSEPVDQQFLRALYDNLLAADDGADRWYEEPFYAKHYWREAL